jgi:hypothetical protein
LKSGISFIGFLFFFFFYGIKSGTIGIDLTSVVSSEFLLNTWNFVGILSPKYPSPPSDKSQKIQTLTRIHPDEIYIVLDEISFVPDEIFYCSG